MIDADERIRDALATLAPEPLHHDVINAAVAHRARTARQRALIAAVALAAIIVTTAALTTDDNAPRRLDTVTVPAPTTTGAAPTEITIPDVSGLDPVLATQTLSRLDLDVARAIESSDTVVEGLVTRTDPPYNTSVSAGSTVTLYVSSRLPEGVVPNLVPLSVDAAIRAITDAGYVPQATPFDVPDGAAEAGKVIAQNPAAGTRATKGSTVEVTYGRPT